MPRRTNASTGIWRGQMPRGTNSWADKWLKSGQMPGPVGSGICPPGTCPDQMWVQGLNFRHLSSWHLSGPNVGAGICPPGICPNQKWVLAVVQTKSGSWHLSDPKNGPGICPNWRWVPGICPNGICPIKNCLQAFVRTESGSLAFVQMAFVRSKIASRHLSDQKLPPGICPPTFGSDKCHEDKCLEPIFDRTNARRTNAWTHILFGQMPGLTLLGRTNAWTNTFGSDKCLDVQMPWRTNAFEAFVC